MTGAGAAAGGSNSNQGGYGGGGPGSTGPGQGGIGVPPHHQGQQQQHRSYEDRAAAREQMMNNIRETSQQDRRVYVGNLSYDVKWHHLKDFMRQGTLWRGPGGIGRGAGGGVVALLGGWYERLKLTGRVYLQLETCSSPMSCYFPTECRRWAPTRSFGWSFSPSGFFVSAGILMELLD